MSRPCIIFDVDGTLADLRHRLHFLEGGRRDWDGFFTAAGADLPLHEIVKLNQWCDPTLTHEIVLCSGRPERLREVTRQWLIKYGVRWDRLYMRPDGDTRQDAAVKRELLARIRADGFEPILAIDDRPSIVEVWREAGICTLQVHAPGATDVEVIPPSAVLTVMVGPSGGGKSTWLNEPAAEALGIHSSHVISSDQLRVDLCGDFLEQSRNSEVFTAMHAVARARLRAGLPTVLDATHLHRRDRLAARNLAPPHHPVRYIVVDRSLEEKRRTGGWRNELDFDLIGKHHQSFQSGLREILAGDSQPNVTVIDTRAEELR